MQYDRGEGEREREIEAFYSTVCSHFITILQTRRLEESVEGVCHV